MSSTRTRPVQSRSKFLKIGGIAAAIFLITLGIFASNGWLPSTDPMTGRKTGWFGKTLPKNATSAWNPFPPPSPTPQLSKEYIYAGSRLLAVEDANATAAPPADIALWRGSNGYWYVQGQTGSANTTFQFGASGDIPTPGDFDGDGKTDFAVYRPDTGSHTGTWWIYFSDGSGYTATQYGNDTDTPVQADYDGDGKTDLAVYRSSNQTFYILGSTAGSISQAFGNSGDIPASADYDGDGRADIATYRTSNEYFYYISSATGSSISINFGETGDKVVSSDYDGDGKADPAVFVNSSAYWHILPSTTNSVSSVQWGSSGDTPVQNDYEGDGKTDIATWHPLSSDSVWSIKKSSTGTNRTE